MQIASLWSIGRWAHFNVKLHFFIYPSDIDWFWLNNSFTEYFSRYAKTLTHQPIKTKLYSRLCRIDHENKEFYHYIPFFFSLFFPLPTYNYLGLFFSPTWTKSSFYWAQLCLCTVGSYALLSVCLSVVTWPKLCHLTIPLSLDQNSKKEYLVSIVTA